MNSLNILEVRMLKLLVVFGSQSSEHEISCISAGNILENIDLNKYTVTKLGINKAGEWFKFKGSNKSIKSNSWINEKENLEVVKDVIGLIKEHDVAFPVLHGKFGEDGTIQGLFELCEVKYVGCGVLASAVGMDKEFTKILASLKSVPIVPYQAFSKGQEVILDKSIVGDYPLIVKPSNAGSSYGVTKVSNEEELMKAVEHAFLYDKKLLIEKFIPAREIELAVLGNVDLIISEPGEILSAHELYDFDAKYNNADSRVVIPADLKKEEIDRLKSYSEKVYRGINGRGLSRIDFFISKKDGEIYFNEINTLPGCTDISMYPKMMECSGISYKELIDKLIELAMV
jgi:D-alanine-D-alanine ligase